MLGRPHGIQVGTNVLPRLPSISATFESIDVRILVDTVAVTEERSALRIRLSPQPKEHAIWRSLEAAIASIKTP